MPALRRAVRVAAFAFSGLHLNGVHAAGPSFGVTVIGTAAYPAHKPGAGAKIDPAHALATGLVTALPLDEGTGTTYTDPVTTRTYSAQTLSNTPSGGQPPAWFYPPITSDYPWLGPAISNNNATAQAIQSTLQPQDIINNPSPGYSYATLVQPLDATTFGRNMDATGSAVVTQYLNIPGKLGLVASTWRDGTDGAIVPTSRPFIVNKWILVLCTVQQGLGVMYINGVAVTSSTLVDLTNSWADQTGLLVYNTTGNGAQMCNANFSSWWIWNNRVLSAAEAAQLYANPWSMYESGEKGFIKGTSITLKSAAAISNVHFYSHAAAGHVRLAIYDNNAPKHLLWQSASTSNTAANAWLTVPIASGTPAALTMPTGAYWLVWQVDTTQSMPSYSAGGSGNGFLVNAIYGTFPAALSGGQTTAERWSIYLDTVQSAVSANRWTEFN